MSPLIFSYAGSLRNLPANLHRDEMKLIVSAGDCRVFDHGPATVEQILTEQGINPLDVIVSRNGRLVPEDTVLEADDEIRITQYRPRGLMDERRESRDQPYRYVPCAGNLQ